MVGFERASVGKRGRGQRVKGKERKIGEVGKGREEKTYRLYISLTMSISASA
jgi:hypothetical protein